ncbi:hypothetical protein BAE44_0004212 [Dichanthelium oligosanthes]|uniref:Uncharacterized protein n=1 Tax=Dichanthelium oligosanthes TaxID=888268 RepID=A0A1E5WC03_9POAL|nr:hypothetical protein BAE44_0004212 [Dichanthelium oligosanthes]
MCTFIRFMEQCNHAGEWNIHMEVTWLFPHEKPLTSLQSCLASSYPHVSCTCRKSQN